mgnify:CR=1 FL=1|tara:strand:+ start:2973 stop:3584 length:612 start_codon:yes stop_codon:yes gene_type:complete
MTIETRTAQFSELRAVSGSNKVAGYAAMFGKRSVDLGGFVEVIQAGAFKRSLESDDDIKALIEHGGIAIGRRANKTLELREDKNGLNIEIDLPDTTAGNDIRKSIERGDVDQMSFGFRVRTGGAFYDETDEGLILRTLTDVELHEVSIVTFPAYPDTSIAKRSVQAWREEMGESLAEQTRQWRDQMGRKLQIAERSAILSRKI